MKYIYNVTTKKFSVTEGTKNFADSEDQLFVAAYWDDGHRGSIEGYWGPYKDRDEAEYQLERIQERGTEANLRIYTKQGLFKKMKGCGNLPPDLTYDNFDEFISRTVLH